MPTPEFRPVQVAILTVSDTRTPETDKSGSAIADALTEAGHVVKERRILPDDVEKIRGAFQRWTADPNVDAIIATGGTGITGRDVTPEAMAPLVTKPIPGF